MEKNRETKKLKPWSAEFPTNQPLIPRKPDTPVSTSKLQQLQNKNTI